MAEQKDAYTFESIDQVREYFRLGKIDLETAQILAGILTAHSPCQILSNGKEFLVFKKIDDNTPMNFDDYPEVAHGG